MGKIWILIGGLILLAFAVKAIGTSRGNSVAAKTKIAEGALVLDVRTPGEYRAGHFEGAVNLPLQELESRLSELKEKNRAVVVYCASGMRSAQAAKILTAAGFSDVTNAGGLGNLQ